MGNSFSKKLKLKKTKKFKTTILDLPNEILVQIFSKLPQRDLLKNVALVSRRFFEVSRLHQTLPVIKIPCYNQSIDNCIEIIQKGLKIYPESKIGIDDLRIATSKFKALNSFVPLINKMTILIDFEWENDLPVFENLKQLKLFQNDIGPKLQIRNSDVLWKKFPNLTSLMMNKIRIEKSSNKVNVKIIQITY